MNRRRALALGTSGLFAAAAGVPAGAADARQHLVLDGATIVNKR